MLKRGYAKGEKTLEIIEGNVDVVLYNEKGDSFYFYRFPPDQVFGESHGISRGTNLLFRPEVEKFLKGKNRDYEGLINELISTAVDSGMKERYEL